METINNALDTFNGTIAEEMEVPFSVHGGPISLDDIPDSEDNLIPASRNVHLLVKKAEIRCSKDGNTIKINVCWQLVEGVEIDGEQKYVNKTFFQNGNFFDQFFVYANPNTYNSDYYKSMKHLSNTKALYKALGLTTINPDYVEELIGLELVGDIVQVPNQVKNESGAYVNDGTFTNAVKNFKSLG